MKPIVAAMIILPLTVSCGLPIDQLVGSVLSRTQIPPRVLLLCAPILRDVDIEAIVIQINAGRDEGVSKTAAITVSGTTCNETATELLAIATSSESTTESETGTSTEPLIEFNALDAAVYETNCTNCYIAIIDALYDN